MSVRLIYLWLVEKSNGISIELYMGVLSTYINHRSSADFFCLILDSRVCSWVISTPVLSSLGLIEPSLEQYSGPHDGIPSNF